MAIGTRLTLAGARLLAKAMQGKQLKFTRGAFGDAKVNNQLVEPTDEQQDNLNALINERMSLPIYYYEFGDNGDFTVGVKVKNANVNSTFKAAEAGLFAEDPDTGAEILYGYSYEGADGDKIHAKNSYCVLEYYVEFVTTIANATNVTCVINIKEKIKAGDGLSRAGDTINVNAGTGLGISSLNNVYLKRATDTAKGGVIITGNDGLFMDGETLKAEGYKLPTASKTVKGGVIITGNDGLIMDGETLKLPTASKTVKGGVKVGLNLYMTGDSINSSVEPYDDSLLNSRINQLEINQSNLFMRLNANNELGITANLLLVEDFVECDTLDRAAKLCDVDKSSTSKRSFDIINNADFAKIGRDYTIGWKGLDKPIHFTDILDGNNQAGDRAFIYYFDGDLDDWYEIAPNASSNVANPLNNAKIYRTTAGIVSGAYAYGPGDTFIIGGQRGWNGIARDGAFTARLMTGTSYESKFDMSDDAVFTSDGYFTISD